MATILNYFDRVHAKQKAVTLQDAQIDVPTQEYSAAGYFLISGGRDATGDDVATPDNWWPGYNIDFGIPSGPRTYYAGLFQRNFLNGMVLLNEPGAPEKTVYLDGVYSRPDGSSNTSVSLQGRQGALLTRTGPLPGGRFLSDLNWLTATNGWLNVRRDLSTDGNALTLNGNRYLKGLGVHAGSTIHYDLGRACTGITATIGIDDEVPPGTGSADFQVWLDGVQKFDSGHMTGGSAAQTVNVDLTGAQDLALVVTDGGLGNGNSHSDWANAFLNCASFSPSPRPVRPIRSR